MPGGWHFNSGHPPGVKNGFIKGKAMRLLRTNSSKRTFEESLVKSKQCLRTCGYPKTIIERSLSVVNFTTRPSALTQKKKADKDFAFLNYVPPSSEQSQTDTDGTMESNTKSAFAENYLFETSDNIVQKR